MALQSFPDKIGTIIYPDVSLPRIPSSDSNSNVGTMNAVGESAALIGYLHLEGGSGSKTISSGGGKIYFATGGSNTFANAGTNLRIGIQDVDATGNEDGTFDVYADLVGGTDTITSNAIRSTAMETGSKTMSHGDLIAIAFEMTARGGTDSVTLRNRSTGGVGMPYMTTDTGSGVSKAGGAVFDATIEFDDGTIGWIQGCLAWHTYGLTGNINTGTTPDEYALIFQLPFPAMISGAQPMLNLPGTTSDFEVILYSDPLGTPVAERTTAVDGDLLGGITVTTRYYVPFSSDYSLAKNTKYALAVRPTTANSLTLMRMGFNTGNAKLRRPTVLGENASQGTRSNQTGSFSEDTLFIPAIGMVLSKFDDASQPIGQAKVVQAFGSY